MDGGLALPRDASALHLINPATNVATDGKPDGVTGKTAAVWWEHMSINLPTVD